MVISIEVADFFVWGRYTEIVKKHFFQGEDLSLFLEKIIPAMEKIY